MSDETNAPGWDAIDEAMRKVYGSQEPKHYGTLIPYMMGGADPLNGISAYTADSPIPHWHFVTYGFSELYEEQQDDPSVSGYGFELTFRLVKGEDEEEPPAWAMNLLQNMGRYVFNSGNVFRAGDYLDANGPICLGSDTQLTALAFVEDPELPKMDTPNGQVIFLQMIGVTAQELEAIQAWSALSFLEACESINPMHLTNLKRESFLSIGTVKEAVLRGSERDGSSTGFLFVDQLNWEPRKKRLLGSKPAVLQVGAKQADIIGKLLRGRLLKGKSLSLSSRGVQVSLKFGEKSGYVESDNSIAITLNEPTIIALAPHFQPQAGTFVLPTFKDIAFQIVQTEIRDQDSRIVQTIG